VQVNPAGVTADYLHVWDQPATYPPDAIDVPFYRANHHADIHFDVAGLQAASQVIPLSEGRARWIAMLKIPLRQALEAEGLKPTLQPGQSIRLNLLRYAWSESNGQRNFRQFSLVPVKHGCPHQSPTAMKTFTLTR
jgi:hypothetical protein